MKSLVKHVQNIRAQHMLWNVSDTIIVGVSGGPDSMCLFDVLLKISQKMDITLVVAHVNYRLRGEASKKDQKLVENIAKKHNVLCDTLICDNNIEQSENAWRNIRYEFFDSVLKKYGANSVAVAHTKNDQAETLLLHLLRGSGLRGLVGMQLKSNNQIIRPLIDVSRDDIIKYCEDNDVLYNMDKTNNNTSFTRNKIRHKLIPYLEKDFNANIVTVLTNSAKIIGDDYNLLTQVQDKFWVKNNNIIIFSAKDFLEKHISLQRTILFEVINQVQGSVVDINSGIIEEFRKVISSTKNKHQEVCIKDLKMLKKGDTVELVHT